MEVALLVVEGKRLSRNLSVSRGVFASQLEHVLLNLCVPERLAYSPSISPREIIRHVGMEIQIFFLAYKVSLLGCNLKLLVIPVDQTDSISNSLLTLVQSSGGILLFGGRWYW